MTVHEFVCFLIQVDFITEMLRKLCGPGGGTYSLYGKAPPERGTFQAGGI